MQKCAVSAYRISRTASRRNSVSHRSNTFLTSGLSKRNICSLKQDCLFMRLLPALALKTRSISAAFSKSISVSRRDNIGGCGMKNYRRRKIHNISQDIPFHDYRKYDRLNMHKCAAPVSEASAEMQHLNCIMFYILEVKNGEIYYEKPSDFLTVKCCSCTFAPAGFLRRTSNQRYDRSGYNRSSGDRGNP